MQRAGSTLLTSLLLGAILAIPVAFLLPDRERLIGTMGRSVAYTSFIWLWNMFGLQPSMRNSLLP